MSTPYVEKELAAWRKLAIARGKILVAYRVGGRTPGKAIDDAIAAEEWLRRAQIDPHTGKEIPR